MVTQSSPVTSSNADQVTAPSSNAPITIGICCLAIIAALVVGVGMASNLVIRHIVQTLPLWAAVVLGFRRSRATSWVALPFFVFWLFLMCVIWAFLLGMTHMIGGHFSVVEIAMTIIVGAAALLGVVSFARFHSSLSALSAASLFLVSAAIQLFCFRISFLPAIAHR